MVVPKYESILSSKGLRSVSMHVHLILGQIASASSLSACSFSAFSFSSFSFFSPSLLHFYSNRSSFRVVFLDLIIRQQYNVTVLIKDRLSKYIVPGFV